MFKSIKLHIVLQKYRVERCVVWYELWVVAVTHHRAKRDACESGNYTIVLASETDRCTDRKNILALSFLLEGGQIVRLREEE